MRIKRIDLCGFKSFCDKTSLDLQQPISAIVGPNGCGKSNVVDALRWAMGEQSARHLRGKAMEDVIFNGSESRGPSGMAEISITFENDHSAGVAYLDYNEITVTRRLHRDGTSEYLINKLPVRLRDVTNLFLGTGVGTKAYSIIEQGRVGLIVSSKPEERRYFIEEAAGITKYRRRKQLAERKIEATRQNLLRVSDVVQEIERRLGSLRRQAQKAERYKRYKEEMRDIELWSASHRLLEIVAMQKLVEADLAELGGHKQQLDVDIERRDLDIETARLQVTESERQADQLQQQLYELDNRIKLNENRIEFQTREADDLQRRADQSRGEIEQLHEQLEQELQREQDVRRQTAAIQQQRDSRLGELAERDRVLAEVSADLADVETALDAERDTTQAAERAAARAEAELGAAVQRQQDLQARADRVRLEISASTDRQALLQAEAADLSGELSTLGVDRQQLASQKEQAVERLTELRARADRGEAELEVLRTELHRRRSRLASLEEIQERYEGFGHGTRAVMQRHNGSSRQEGILGVVADVLDTPADYETALEAVLGHRLGTVIVEDNDVGLDAIQYLKQGSLGRGSFISRQHRQTSVLEGAPIGFVWDPQAADFVWDPQAARGSASGSMMHMGHGGGAPMAAAPAAGVRGTMLNLVSCDQEYSGIAEALLGDVVVVEDLDRAVTLWDHSVDKTLVTLEGEILQPDGTVTGGCHEAEMSGVLQQKREIRELSEIISELQEQYDGAHQKHVSVRTEIAALDQALEDVTHEEHHGEKEILTREKDLVRIREEIQQLTDRSADLDTELAQLVHSMDGVQADHARLEGEIAVAADQCQVGQDTLYLLGVERQRIGTQVTVASAAATDLKVHVAHTEASCQAAEENLQQICDLIEERKDRINRLDRGADEGLQRSAELRDSALQLRDEMHELVNERAGLQTSLEQHRQAYEEQTVALGELEATAKEARRELADLNARLGEIQIKTSELAMSRSHVEEQTWERYREQLHRVAGDFHLRPPVSDKDLERLEQLRQLIFRMGEINLTAIDEYEELNGRHEFLTSQKADLESALNQLQRAIQKINRTCRERFVETFELVNAKFQQVFPRLFSGGRASLKLTEADDVLQGGVEIIAQPPGKKLVSIDMMSGGEKALTATSLIFAMFLVKPTPFCLLDEVDAPLDDANVLRLRDLVRELAATSQFIMITHNHNTMEAADLLYGVTMEEPGISKLVSVNLNEARQVAA